MWVRIGVVMVLMYVSDLGFGQSFTFEPAQAIDGPSAVGSGPESSLDGLTLLFTNAPTGDGNCYWAFRTDLGDPFGPPMPIPGINSSYHDGGAVL